MSYIFNAAFCENPRLLWDDFKNQILFPMTTNQIYDGKIGDYYNTGRLRELLATITTQVDYRLIQDLPLRSAIVIRYASLLASRNYWLTNIPEVASVLPSSDLPLSTNIKAQQSNLELVSSLMCSTAIPKTFPPQKLYYKDSSNNKSLPIKLGDDTEAEFVDGGWGVANMVFSAYRNFFDIYVSKFGKFDQIYFISPKFVETEPAVLERINLANSNGTLAEGDSLEDNPLAIMEAWTKNFLKDIKTYNSAKKLANTIYYCKPEIEIFPALDFSNEKEQYDATITWGQNNRDNIAIDINTISDI